MKQIFTWRFAAVFAISIGIFFYGNAFQIHSVAWRSAFAGIVAGAAVSQFAGSPDRYAPVIILGVIATATVYAVIYFGNVFNIGSLLLRLSAAIVLGSLTGGATDFLTRGLRHRQAAALLGVIALGLSFRQAHAAPPDPNAAWAAGYAAAVARACPNWHTDAAAIDRAGGVPDLLHGDDWAPGKPAAENFAAGARAADLARANKRFCTMPMPHARAGRFLPSFLVGGRLPA